MKYIKEAVMRTNAKWLILMSVVSGIMYCVINAAIVVWLTAAIEGDTNAASKVVLGCIINTILSALGRLDTSNGIIFEYMSNKLADKVIHADYNMFVKFSPDSILVTHSNVKHISSIVKQIKHIIISLMTVIVNIYAIFILNTHAVLPILPIFTIAALCMVIGFRKWFKLDRKFDSYRRASDKALYDAVNGFSEVRSFVDTEKEHLQRIVRNRREATKILFRRAMCDFAIRLSNESANSMSTIILMILSVGAVANGSIEVAIGINTVMYGWRIAQPITTFIDATSDFAETMAFIGPYTEIMSFKNTVPEGNIDIRTLKYEIRFDNVSFKYETDSDEILNNVSFTINRGEHIGICGTSGGGKSTLLRLIPKFYDRTGGSIAIDSVDIRNISKTSLRAMIGIVHQDPYIFDGSIMDNIKYANKSADYFQVVDACKKAFIYDFIMELKDRFETYVGPKGMKLSGGQKQRIALARIFLSDPDIIILDEATSALDTVTEKFIQNMMDTVFKDKTMIVVAHRLSTIVNSDRILVLDEGRVVEEGSHTELLEQKAPIYAKLIGEDNKLY